MRLKGRRPGLVGGALALLVAVVGIVPAHAAPPPQGRARPATFPPACRAASFEGSSFAVCRYAAGADRLRLAWGDAARKPLGGLPALQRALGARAARLRFAMNAGMYEPSQAPVGLLVENGVTVAPIKTAAGAGNFYLQPNGVFSVDADGTPHVDETSAFLDRKAHPQWATQSGPLLMRAGVLHPEISPDGPSRLVRNGVGICGPGVAEFAISDGPVSMGRFARFMRDGLGCPDVLYFDGNISSLWAPGLKRQDTRTGLGPLVYVLAGRARR